MSQTALLLLAHPRNLVNSLSKIRTFVSDRLYIQLQPCMTKPWEHFYTKDIRSWYRYSPVIYNIYNTAYAHCPHLDIRVLLSNITFPTYTKTATNRQIDTVVVDENYEQNDIRAFVNENIRTVKERFYVVNLTALDDFKNTLDSFPMEIQSTCSNGVCKNAAAYGTFDRLHSAHKCVLSEAVLRATTNLTVGVFTDVLLQKRFQEKVLDDLIEDYPTRARNVETFVRDICPRINCNVVPVESHHLNLFAADPKVDMLVTGEDLNVRPHEINMNRGRYNIPPLKLITLPNMGDVHSEGPPKTAQISATNLRIDSLGTVVKWINQKDLPNLPYVIGVTGSMGSGKTTLCEYLKKNGVSVISCDQIGRQQRQPGGPVYEKLIEEFGNDVLNEKGMIDNVKLGMKIFKDVEHKKKFNSITWPAIGGKIQEEIELRSSYSNIIVIESTHLTEAGWDNFCHEIWATFLPRNQQVPRLAKRIGMTEEQATNLLDRFYPPNSYYIRRANVLFSLIWDEVYNEHQVIKAFRALPYRMEQ